MHFTFKQNGEIVRSWDAGQVIVSDGKKRKELRESFNTVSSEVNSAIGYMVDGAVNGANPSAVKESAYAPIALAALAKLPDSAVIEYGMPELNSEYVPTGKFTIVYRVPVSAVRKVAELINAWNQDEGIKARESYVVAQIPSAPVEGKAKTRGGKSPVVAIEL